MSLIKHLVILSPLHVVGLWVNNLVFIKSTNVKHFNLFTRRVMNINLVHSFVFVNYLFILNTMTAITYNTLRNDNPMNGFTPTVLILFHAKDLQKPNY